MTTLNPSMTIVVHGTKPGRWWQPNESFCQALSARLGDVYTSDDYFKWSGGNSDTERRQAARELVDWVGRRLAPKGALRLVCHSHGGNVAMLATRLGLEVHHLMLLGTPIRMDYRPDMGRIERLDNIYVPWDSIQDAGCNEPLSLFRAVRRHKGEGRTVADTSNALNHSVMQGMSGGLRCHSQLYEWDVWTLNGLDKLLP